MTSAVGNAAGQGYSEGDGIRISTGTGAETSARMDVGMRDDLDGLKGAKSKVDIITPDKTNKISIPISY